MHFWEEHPKIAMSTFLGLGVFAIVSAIRTYLPVQRDYLDNASMAMLFAIGIGLIVCGIFCRRYIS